MGNQCNIYLSSELLAELEAEAQEQGKRYCKPKTFTPQAMLRIAWDLRPKSLRRATAGKSERRRP